MIYYCFKVKQELCFLPVCVCRKVNGTPCIATKSCLDTMTNFGCRDYSLSHQLLYFLIGKMVREIREIFFVTASG